MNVIKEIEKTYPETCSEFKRLQKEQYETFCKKQYDYGQHNITLGMDLSDSNNRHLSITAIIIRINDRGPYVNNRILDCSFGAAKKLNFVNEGTASVKIEVIEWGDGVYMHHD